ncbi:DinB family protein [Ochrovirga pacifica]|uniref:DinB family protein n=1 Tax=Ochrovirga pacifica TaxID=1042376 RepID=UPI0002558E4A|nr:DinB family protein [Ochrovirga pacifica]
MEIANQIDGLKKGRALMLKVIEGYTLEQINTIPQGFNNNIGWNIAHLVVTPYLLCYKMSGLLLPISDEMVNRYRKGTAPNGHVINAEEWQQILDLFVSFADELAADYQKGIFENYTEYTTSVGVCLNNVERAIDFNTFHEGIHLGAILALRKLV